MAERRKRMAELMVESEKLWFLYNIKWIYFILYRCFYLILLFI